MASSYDVAGGHSLLVARGGTGKGGGRGPHAFFDDVSLEPDRHQVLSDMRAAGGGGDDCCC